MPIQILQNPVMQVPGILPCVRLTSLKKDVYMATNAISVMLRQKESPKVKERRCKRISCDIEGVHTTGLCISRFLSEKNTWSNSPNAPGTKILERKGPSRGIIRKCAPHERSPCPPEFGERSREETLHQERCARRAAWDLANIFTSSKFGRSFVLFFY